MVSEKISGARNPSCTSSPHVNRNIMYGPFVINVKFSAGHHLHHKKVLVHKIRSFFTVCVQSLWTTVVLYGCRCSSWVVFCVSCNKNQLNALISQFYFILEWNSTCFGEFLCRIRVEPWSCLQAVHKLVWRIPLHCVQWKTPDDGQRNCPKHVEFHSKIK